MFLSGIIQWSGRRTNSGKRRPLIKNNRRLQAERLERREVFASMVGLTVGNELLTFDSARPEAIVNSVRITGLDSSRDSVVGIDYRPATGLLYAATTTSLYTVDSKTGVATRVNALAPTKPNGGEFGFDFNPVVDRLRVVSDADQNLRINPNDGSVSVDGLLAYSDSNVGRNPNVTGSAYLNPDNDPTTGTVLYGIDSKLDMLVTQNPANAGSLQAVGRLGVDAGSMVGFDIGRDNSAFASLMISPSGSFGGNSDNRNAGDTGLYTINLTTGKATFIGKIGGNRSVRDIAVVLTQQPVFGVTSDNRLVTFNSAAPEVINSSRAITGLATGESILGIDFRPANGLLYGLGSANNVYVINTMTGAATDVNDLNNPALNGDQFGFDFNPAVDALRITSDSDQNMRVPMGGQGIEVADGLLTYAVGDPNQGQNPNIAGSAYVNNFPGTTTTVLYGIDTNLNTLVTQNPANAGTLQTKGALGVDVGSADLVGFDISSGNVAYAALRLEGESVSKLYTINLTTGAATMVVGRGAATDVTIGNEGVIGASRGGSPTIVGIAIAPPVVQFLKSDQSVKENRGNASIVVMRSGDTSGAVSVNFATGGGTATAGSDYTAQSGSLAFTPADIIRVFSLPIQDDKRDERDETVGLMLSNPTGGGGATVGVLSQALLSIFDDDGRNGGGWWSGYQGSNDEDGWWFGRRRR